MYVYRDVVRTPAFQSYCETAKQLQLCFTVYSTRFEALAGHGTLRRDPSQFTIWSQRRRDVEFEGKKTDKFEQSCEVKM